MAMAMAKIAIMLRRTTGPKLVLSSLSLFSLGTGSLIVGFTAVKSSVAKTSQCAVIGE